MKAQRGFGTGDLLIWAIVIASAAGGLWALYIGIDGRGYDRAKGEIEAQYLARDNAQLRAVQNRVRELEEQNSALEAKSVADMAGIDQQYQGDIARETEQKNRALEQLRAGSLVLRDPGATGSACSGGSAAGQARAGAGERDGAAPGRLSVAASEFLLGFASEADAVVDQLTAAQAVIVKDRAVCGAMPDASQGSTQAPPAPSNQPVE